MALEVMRRPAMRWSGAGLAQDAVPLRTMMDRLLESAFTPSTWFGDTSGIGSGPCSLDVYEQEDAYIVQCLLPGITPDAVHVTVQDNVLTISGESTREVPEGAQPVFQEIGYGRFARQVTLSMPVEVDRVEANYRDGLLTITLPKAETAKPRTIKVHANGHASGHVTGRAKTTA